MIIVIDYFYTHLVAEPHTFNYASNYSVDSG